MALTTGLKRAIPFDIPATELAAGTTIELVAPQAGYLDELVTIVQTAIVTGGAITVLTGDAGGTTVAGLSATIADAAAKGSRVTAAATAGSSTRYVAKGDRIQVVPAAAFNGGGAVRGHLVLSDADVSPAL